MKVLVTGTAGQVGSYVVEHFAERHEVVGIDMRKPIYPKAAESTIEGDVRNQQLMIHLLKDVDVVVHCAALVSVEESIKRPDAYTENNVLGTSKVLGASLDAGVKRFVYVSSAAVYGNPVKLPIREDHPLQPVSPYGWSKLGGEWYTQHFYEHLDLPTTIVRPFNIYSARQDPSNPYSGVISKFIARIRAQKPPVIQGDGRQTRDFVSARDVVKFVSLAAERKGAVGQVFNCGTGTKTSINHLASELIDIAGAYLEPEHAPTRPGDLKHSFADMARARRLLGFEPSVKLKDGLRELMRGA
jgi:UDP-glucose 4-epimerase